jgi:hypothetical protein
VKKVKFTKTALREVDLAAAFHEGRKEGLGVEFYERVDEAVASIRQNPEATGNSTKTCGGAIFGSLRIGGCGFM